LFDDDRALVFDHLRIYFLLLTRFQITFVLSFLTHALYGIHYIGLLRQKCVAEVSGPLDVVCQSFDDVRQPSHGLNAWIPRLLSNGICEGFVLQSGVLCQKLLKLDDFERIS